jgi:tetratricopeptide (TPR) repeat protein
MPVRRKNLSSYAVFLFKSSLLSLTALYLLMVPADLLAAGLCDPALARAISVQGTLEVRRAHKQQWQPAGRDESFCPGDAVRTGANSRSAILLYPETVIRLDQYSSLVFTTPETETTPTWLELLKGAAHFISRDPRSLKIITPLANAAITGTEFLVQVDEHETGVTVYEGRVEVSNPAGSVQVGANQRALARAGQAPITVAVVHPRDAVQWTLYYPPVFSPNAPLNASLQQAAQALAVGRVNQAQSDLSRVLAHGPNNSDALALQSIIALTQNDSTLARELAQRAVTARPTSAAAGVAMSYVQQADFDLNGALKSLENAVRDNPDDALAWARLAELRLSTGYLDEGLKAAERANLLDPGLALTQTVKGYAYLMQIKLPQAREAFDRAIDLDQAAPLPRLGLGLAKIRKGELKAGREDIESAVALDPGNSLMRSYMGKAYYEEKRDRLAGAQYDMAKTLDPKDPTPWFYDAIRKQTENRPVEALHDMQTSIALNDNRAVYRSRLQLDQDLATRSASQARIYNDLGFEQLALVKGWQSVNTDPANYSAHRLLSDSYSALPRHEIARVSELLQSQLLQPINLTPVPPELAEENIFILEGAGPANPSYLEFNPLFTRNRLALQADGLAGSNSTWADDVVHNGVYNNWSWSAGQFHYQSDGYRDNNDQNQNIYDLFVQGALSYKTSVQAEYRDRRIKNGDLVQRFEPDNFSHTQREKIKDQTVRLGLHHLFTPGSEIIASLIYLYNHNDDVNDTVPQDVPPLGTFNTTVDAENPLNHGLTAELQHIFRGNAFKLVTGAGYFTADGKFKAAVDNTLTPAPPLPPIEMPFSSYFSEADQNWHHKNAYFYAYIPFHETLMVTAGASYDDLSLDQDTDVTRTDFVPPPPTTTPTSSKSKLGVQKLNPKLGVTWLPWKNTTVRAAAFRTITRSLVSNQTIEPTQVAGFNQFYNDQTGTRADVYGVAADQIITQDLSTGVEYSWRNTSAPYQAQVGGGFNEADWDEGFGRAYLYWTPTRRVATSAEYQYEDFKRDQSFTGEFQATRIQTQRVPLTASYFHPLGLFARVRTTYYDQQGKFTTNEAGFLQNQPTEDKNDQFWLVDASVGYRLPKRYGFISVGVSNLFDENFKFVDTDPFNPQVYPERFFFSRLTLSF